MIVPTKGPRRAPTTGTGDGTCVNDTQVQHTLFERVEPGGQVAQRLWGLWQDASEEDRREFLDQIRYEYPSRRPPRVASAKGTHCQLRQADCLDAQRRSSR